MKTVIVYESGDLLTADQAADHFGYTRDHFRNMLTLSNKAADPRLMRLRIASINDLPIKESERKYHWPLGRRPDGHPSLSELGL